MNTPRRHRPLAISLGLLALAIIIGAGAWWMRRDASRGGASSRHPAPPLSAAARAAAAKPADALAAELMASPRGPDLREIFRAMTNRQLIAVFRTLGRTDFRIACELAEFTRDPRMYRGRALAGYAESDPRAALTWALANPSGSNVVGRDNWYVTQWAAGAFATGKDVLYELLAQTTDPRRKEDLIDGILHHPVITGNYQAVFDDARAVAAVTAHEKQALLGYASSWSQRDADGLLRYAATVQDPLAQRPLFMVAVTLYAKLDPSEAGAWAMKVDPENRMDVISSLCHHWAYFTPEPLSLLAWLKDQGRDSGVYADVARKALAPAIGRNDFARGLELAAEIVDETRRYDAFQLIAFTEKRKPGFADHIRASRNPLLQATAAEAYAGSEPKLAVELIGRLPEGELKRRTVERVSEIWKKDETSHARWLHPARARHHSLARDLRSIALALIRFSRFPVFIMRTPRILQLAIVSLCVSTAATAAGSAKFPGVPGVVVNHSPISSNLFVPTSSLTVLPDGTYLVAHDYAHFDKQTESSPNIVRIFASTDRGRTWQQRSQVQGRWDSLFVHRGAVYLFGPQRMHGPAVIRRSTDNGKTWTEPKDAKSGLLDASTTYHSAGVPVLIHGGRVWRAFEQSIGGEKNRIGWLAVVFSAPVDADLLDARNWTISEPLHHGGKIRQWIEGNMVVAPDGGVVNVIRTNSDQSDKAMIIRASADGKKLSCDVARDLIDLPGGGSKFTIRFDEKSRRYWTLANKQTNPTAKRNVLVLAHSPDLRTWTVAKTILSDPDQEKIGFHYVDWVADGEDMIFTSRTAYPDGMGGPRNHHDNNFITFHRIENFRQLR